MDFKEIQSRARSIRKKYSAFENKNGHEWTRQEVMEGFVGDVGDLMKLIMAKEGVRQIPEVDRKLAHELSDCLWSIIVLADAYDIDLEKSFMNTMDALEIRLGKNS